jgi:hypothetical protein
LNQEKNMPLLQVRNFPDEVYDKVTSLVKAEHRSVPQETIVLVERGIKNDIDCLESPHERTLRVLREVKEHPIPTRGSEADHKRMMQEAREELEAR